jgi:hypothetical protein
MQRLGCGKARVRRFWKIRKKYLARLGRAVRSYTRQGKTHGISRELTAERFENPRAPFLRTLREHVVCTDIGKGRDCGSSSQQQRHHSAGRFRAVPENALDLTAIGTGAEDSSEKCRAFAAVSSENPFDVPLHAFTCYWSGQACAAGTRLLRRRAGSIKSSGDLWARSPHSGR